MTATVTRESAAVKGRRYVAEGRLCVREVTGDRISATCRGDGAVYRQRVEGPLWSCTCPARARCAHLYALGLVTVITRTEGPP